MDGCIDIASKWFEEHPPVGTFIGVLALIGVLVPLFREWGKIGRLEKAMWTFAMFALLGLELRTLQLDRKEHDREQELARCRQLQSFQAIADKLHDSIKIAQQQYSSTIEHVEGVLKTTQQVSALSKENLENVTGGDSYAYVFPSAISDGDDEVTLNVHNYGKQVLTGVNVTVRHILGAQIDPLSKSVNGGRMEGFPAVNVGSLAPQDGRNVPPPNGIIRPVKRRDGSDHYHIWINAQNSGTAENLDFRRSLDGRGWAYKITAWRFATGKRKAGDFFLDETNQWARFVKQGDWVEPSKSQ